MTILLTVNNNYYYFYFTKNAVRSVLSILNDTLLQLLLFQDELKSKELPVHSPDSILDK